MQLYSILADVFDLLFRHQLLSDEASLHWRELLLGSPNEMSSLRLSQHVGDESAGEPLGQRQPEPMRKEENRPLADEKSPSLTVVHVSEEERQQLGRRLNGPVGPVGHDELFSASDLSPSSVAAASEGTLKVRQGSLDTGHQDAFRIVLTDGV